MNKVSEKSTIQLRVLNERVKELLQELQEFTILEVEAVTVRDKLKWGLRVAETKELLSMNKHGIEVTGELMKLELKMELLEDGDFGGLMELMTDINNVMESL